MKAKRKWRWVSRDECSNCVVVHTDVKKPVLAKTHEGKGYWRSRYSDYAEWEWSDFLAVFSINIKSGECKKVEFSARVVSKGAVT